MSSQYILVEPVVSEAGLLRVADIRSHFLHVYTVRAEAQKGVGMLVHRKLD